MKCQQTGLGTECMETLTTKAFTFPSFQVPTWLILNEDFLCGQQPTSLQRTLLFWVDSSSPPPSGFLNRLKSSMARNKGWPHLMPSGPKKINIQTKGNEISFCLFFYLQVEISRMVRKYKHWYTA